MISVVYYWQLLRKEVAMAKRYRIELTAEERFELELLTKKDRVGAKKFVRARTLLLCESGPEGPAWKSARIAQALGITSRTVENTKRRFVEGGMETALERKKRETPPVPSIFDGDKEAMLLALACSSPPPGRKRWTVRLLAEELVRLDIFEQISKSSVQNALKKNELKPHLKKCWKIPPKQSAAFVACMEDILAVYHLRSEVSSNMHG